MNVPDSTGITYLYKFNIIKNAREDQIALVSAISGIATTLLENERTLQSLYKVTVNITENSTCKVSRRDQHTELFLRSTILVIDKITMEHQYIF